MKSRIDVLYIKHDCLRVCQGDIFRDYEHESGKVDLTSKKVITQKMFFPYIVVLTQDCDLEQDYNNRNSNSEKQDKYLHSILACPAYLAEQLKEGTHLDALGVKMERQPREKWHDIQQNLNPRYHFLRGFVDLQIPDLAIDFKHYFTITRDSLYQFITNHYIGTINELFREALSQRFAYYLSRIGLPEINDHNSVDTTSKVS